MGADKSRQESHVVLTRFVSMSLKNEDWGLFCFTLFDTSCIICLKCMFLSDVECVTMNLNMDRYFFKQVKRSDLDIFTTVKRRTCKTSHKE